MADAKPAELGTAPRAVPSQGTARVAPAPLGKVIAASLAFGAVLAVVMGSGGAALLALRPGRADHDPARLGVGAVAGGPRRVGGAANPQGRPGHRSPARLPRDPRDAASRHGWAARSRDEDSRGQCSRSTRVCAYDRAGQGWSDDSPGPADASGVATDLHALLVAARENGPYVLVGHSSGGVYAMTYASRYPTDVAGMVLLDSASPHQVDLVPSFDGEHQLVRRVMAVVPAIARTGIWQAATPAFTPSLPGDAGRQAALFAVSPGGPGTFAPSRPSCPPPCARPDRSRRWAGRRWSS